MTRSKLQTSAGLNPIMARLSRFAAGAAVVFLALNFIGLIVPMRAPEVTGYVDFAGVATPPPTTVLDRLDALEASAGSFELAQDATRIIHEGIAHIAPAEVQELGYAHYGMRVPVTENWVLFLLSFLKPDTYADYEFCSYRRAIERGTGRCGQQALALVSFLEERGMETGFVSLGGHAIATAKTNEAGWILLDPDYGGVIPYDLARAEAHPESVLEHYWSPAAQQNSLHRLFEPPSNEIKLGGVRARYRRACPIEQVAYVLKWLLPILMFAPLFTLYVRRRLKRSEGAT